MSGINRLSDNDFEMVSDCMRAIIIAECENWVKGFNGDSGFMFSQHENINKINDKMQYQGHSGASFGCTMRMCQRFLDNPDEWNEEVKFHNNKNSSNLIKN